MKKISKIIMIITLVLPLLGTVRSDRAQSGCVGTPGQVTIDSRKIKIIDDDKKIEIIEDSLNVIQKGNKFHVYGEVQSKKEKKYSWLTDVKINVILKDSNGSPISSKNVSVTGDEPRRLVYSTESIVTSTIKRGEKGTFSVNFDAMTNTLGVIEIQPTSNKNQTLPLRVNNKNIKIEPVGSGKFTLRNKKVYGKITNNSGLDIWNTTIYVKIKDTSNGEILFFGSQKEGSSDVIYGNSRDNVLKYKETKRFKINTGLKKKDMNHRKISVWATWEEQLPSDLDIPTDISVITDAGSSNSLILQWLDNSDIEQGYIIFRKSSDSVGFEKISHTVSTPDQIILTNTITTYTDTVSVSSAPVTYTYKVEAYIGKPYVKDEITSLSSNEAEITISN
ncbi:MAG: hypothetical protein HZA77_13765 [Candidatus Schekmanbacteria bacterium]|nr:hypothetical protein [Candidatus Schekmanbacteria bacterium]